MIVVVDYGMGNLRSVAKALAHVAPDRDIVVASDAATIRAAGRVVLPGQSAMPDCMRSLHESGLAATVLDVMTDRPFLGICLGLQMLFDESEEGPTAGLGADSRPCRAVPRRRDGAAVGRAPQGAAHGLEPVRQTRAHPLWHGIADGARFYFAHSYYPVPADPAVTAGTHRLSGAVYLRDCAG